MRIDEAVNETNLRADAQEAVKTFWATRKSSKEKNDTGDNPDQGRRGEATNGKALDDFVSIMKALVYKSGYKDAEVGIERGDIALPGYFRPSKQWDLVITRGDYIVAAIEFKSHMGLKNLGKNYNNRNEEAIGSAADFWATLDPNKYNKDDKDNMPFLGWFLLVEDSDDARRKLKPRVSYGSVDSKYKDVGFLKRYDILCRRLEEKNLYNAAGLMGVSATQEPTGEYTTVGEETSFERFAMKFYNFLVNEASKPYDPAEDGRLL